MGQSGKARSMEYVHIWMGIIKQSKNEKIDEALSAVGDAGSWELFIDDQ